MFENQLSSEAFHPSLVVSLTLIVHRLPILFSSPVLATNRDPAVPAAWFPDHIAAAARTERRQTNTS